MELIWSYNLAKILNKLNFHYEKYIISIKAPKNNKNNNKNNYSKNEKNNNNINGSGNKKELNNNLNNENNNNKDEDEFNNNNNSNPLNENIESENFIHYIHEEFYPIVKNFKNIVPKNINLIIINGYGNCLDHAISYFLNGTESYHFNIREKINQLALIKIRILPNLLIDTEHGTERLYEYIKSINIPFRYSGDFEISLCYELFNINIDVYKEERDDNNLLINLSFINYINNDDNKKNLMILINVSNLHYNLIYYNNTNINLNYNYTNDSAIKFNSDINVINNNVKDKAINIDNNANTIANNIKTTNNNLKKIIMI